MALAFDSAPASDGVTATVFDADGLPVDRSADTSVRGNELIGAWTIGNTAVPATPAGREKRSRRLKSDRSELVIGIYMGYTDEQIGQAAGLSPRTVRSRRQDPDIQQAVTELQALRMERARADILDMLPEAISQLRALLAEAEHEQTRLQAVKFVLQYSSEAIEADDIARRLRDLEQWRWSANEEDW